MDESRPRAVNTYEVVVTNRRKDLDTGADFERVRGHISSFSMHKILEEIVESMEERRPLVILDAHGDHVILSWIEGDSISIRQIEEENR